MQRLRSEASFWQREYRRRLVSSLIRRASPAVNAMLVRELEVSGQPFELDLNGPGVTRRRFATQVLGAAVHLSIPAQDGTLLAENLAWNALRSYEMAGVLLDVQSGLIFQDGKVVRQSGNGHRASRDAAFVTGAYRRVQQRNPVKIDSDVAWLGATSNYYHLLVEVLPRLMRLRELNSSITFLSDSPPSEYLSRIDADLANRVRHMPDDAVVEARTVWAVDPQPQFAPHPADLDLLFSTYASTDFQHSGSSHIFIDRRSDLRMPKTARALRRILPNRGFQAHDFATMRWGNQVHVASSAKTMIGVHGAGLANLVFMPAGGHVIEVTDGSWWFACYRRMAAARGHEYSLVVVPNDDEVSEQELLASILRVSKESFGE